jgi:hypothetical protein
MPFDDPRNQSSQPRLSGHGPGLIGKVLATLTSAVVLVVAFTISLLVFAAVAAIALVVVGYLWWKTRALRKQMREHPPGGRVIEGELVPNPAADSAQKRDG